MRQRVTAPGLPSSPAIYFDKEALQAKVSLRHPTWRGTENALQVVELLVWVARIGLGVFLWNRLGEVDPFGRFILVFLSVAVAVPVPAILFRFAVRGFFARRVFPSRTTLWATPDAIAIESRLYRQPVLIWRRWNEQPIGIRFIFDRDHSAERYSFGLNYKRKLSKDHLNESVMLYAVLTSTDAASPAYSGHQDASMRAIPITEIGSGDASRVTMAFAHAMTLTASRPEEAPTQTKAGIDIDAI